MIRRVFWLLAGAIGGIMGYRRIARRRWARDAARLAANARGFTRDVREGMDLYSARHQPAIGPTLGASANRVRAGRVRAARANERRASEHGAGRDGAGKDQDVNVKDDR